MADIQEKYKQILRKLYDRTQIGSLDWAIDEWEDPFVEVGTRKIVLESGAGDTGDSVVIAKITDLSGKVIERFTDEDIRGGGVPGGAGGWFQMMLQLREAAIRQATGVDKALDELISDLDDGIPF